MKIDDKENRLYNIKHKEIKQNFAQEIQSLGY